MSYITIGYDVWDGKHKKINGLTLFYTHPETLVIRRVPIALTHPTGGTAVESCDTCMCGLERVGAEFEELFRCVNDNCGTAKKAGKP